MKSIRFVTSNTHKFQEAREKFSQAGMAIDHVAMAYPEIQAMTMKQVAIQSASTLTSYLDPPFFIEDSGMTVDSLNGFPGPYSSYVFKKIGWQGILSLLSDKEDRRATFYSVIVYIDSNSDLHVFEGIQNGIISKEARGTGGFGFDPIFIPEGSSHTYAEMSIKMKNQQSHRGKSLQLFLNSLLNKM